MFAEAHHMTRANLRASGVERSKLAACLPQCHEETPLWRARQVWRPDQNQREAEALRPHRTQMEQEPSHVQVRT